MQRSSWVLVLWVVSGLARVEAQETSADQRAAITAAYEKSKNAVVLADFTAVVESCQKALGGTLAEKDKTYTQRLASWALNRRGELYAEQAAKLTNQNPATESAKLDGLALADFEESIKLDDTRWKAFHNRGVSLATQGKLVEALRDFDRTIELKRDYANTWFNRGEIRYEMGKHEDALGDYAEAIRLKPDDAGAYVSRGHCHFRMQKFREALADYSQATRLAPGDASVIANRGDAYRSLSMWEQAANDYRRAIALNDRLGRVYQSAAWMMATCPDARYRDPERALEAARRAIELDGTDDYRYLDSLAAAEANAGRFDDAVKSLDKALAVAPKDAVEPLQARRKLYAEKMPFRDG